MLGFWGISVHFGVLWGSESPSIGIRVGWVRAGAHNGAPDGINAGFLLGSMVGFKFWGIGGRFFRTFFRIFFFRIFLGFFFF